MLVFTDRNTKIIWLYLLLLSNLAWCLLSKRITDTFLADSMYFEIVYPESLQYTYRFKYALNFGTHFDTHFSHVRLTAASPIDACTSIQRSSAAGRMVLIKRGGCSFLTKAINAETSNFAGALIFDNNSENDHAQVDMIADGTNRKTKIPIGFIIGRDGFHIYKASMDKELIINIPLNMSQTPVNKIKFPPWSIW